jgi:predicted alpha/beta-fold hydrolase
VSQSEIDMWSEGSDTEAGDEVKSRGSTLTEESDGGEEGSLVSVYHDTKQEGVGKDEEHDDDDEMTYRLRVYGATDFKERDTSKIPKRDGSISKRLSHEIVRRSSSVVESLPETPQGWTVLVSAILSTALGYELKLQKSLTQPPLTIGQLPHGSAIASIHAKMSSTPESILARSIRPSLFVGTRGSISSTAAYLLGGPSSTEEHIRFREIITMAQDGASIAVDWEVPWRTQNASSTISQEHRKAEILKGPIRQPVVVILHGINNDASFGYMQSLQRSFANRGWNAASMNMRGCGGIEMTTPRSYTGGYTGDLRSLIHHISGRLDKNVPVFLVGNSLGANIMAKYLGEEGLSGTLPSCVSGAASHGNPLAINSSFVKFPLNVVMALGAKKTVLSNWRTNMKDPNFQASYRKALMVSTIAKFDEALTPHLKRNDPFYPYGDRIGFKNGDSYWRDSSSYRLARHIPVPYLNLTADDDFLVSEASKSRLGYLVSNPNVLVVETRCGGHLGWQESPPDSDSSFGASCWADVASADFFDSIMQVNVERNGSPVNKQAGSDGLGIWSPFENSSELRQMMTDEAIASTKQLHSRL